MLEIENIAKWSILSYFISNLRNIVNNYEKEYIGE